MFRCFLSLNLTLRSTSPSTSFDLFSLSNDKRRVEGRRCPIHRKQHLPIGRRRRHVGFSFSFFPLVRTAEKEFPFFSSTFSLCTFSTCGWGALLESCPSRLLLLLGRSWLRGLTSPLIPESSKKTNEQTRINKFWIVSKLTRGEPKLACRINRKKKQVGRAAHRRCDGCDGCVLPCVFGRRRKTSLRRHQQRHSHQH